MVYLHFPVNLTEEEIMLQAKYQKLKKKKRALQLMRSPKPEPEKPALPKRPADARDAKEVARKLIKSGAIPAIPKPNQKPTQSNFKRPRGQERKRVQSDSKVSSYQPFQATSDPTDIPEPSEKTAPRGKTLYNHFVAEREKDERGMKEPVTNASLSPGATAVSPIVGKRVGHTVYVSGYQVTQEFLEKHFSACGNILYVSMEIEKNRGFVTFDKMESADKAIADMDNKVLEGKELKVSLARRQPQIEPINDATSAATWATLASNQSQKGSHKDRRDIVVYDDTIMFE